MSDQQPKAQTTGKVIVREQNQRPWLLCLLVLCILYIGIQQRRLEEMTQYEIKKIQKPNVKPEYVEFVPPPSILRRHVGSCELQTIIYFDPSIPDLDGFLDIHANLAVLRRTRLTEFQNSKITFILPRAVDFIFPRQSKIEIEILDYKNRNEQLAKLLAKCANTVVQTAFDIIDMTQLQERADLNSMCISIPKVVKQRTIGLQRNIGHCSGPFFLKDGDNILNFLSGQSALPKSNEINGISSRDVVALREVTYEKWWPKILSYDLGIVPDTVQKTYDPQVFIAEKMALTKHCTTSPAIFVISESDRIRRRAEIREKLFNENGIRNVFFVLSDHKQENQLHETQLEMESRVYNDVIVGDFNQDEPDAGSRKIVLALQQFLKYCVSQIVTVIDDTVDINTVDFEFRPRDDDLYCSGGSNEHGKIPADHTAWPFGYQIPVHCQTPHFVVRRQVAKQLSHDMVRVNMTGFADSFLFATGIARTVSKIKLADCPPLDNNSNDLDRTKTSVLFHTMTGTDMSKLMAMMKDTPALFALSNPTAALFGGDERKYLTPAQTKLQLAMGGRILLNGFNCQLKPQNMIIKEYVNKNGTDALTHKGAEFINNAFQEFDTDKPYDQETIQTCQHRGVRVQTSSVLSNLKESVEENVLPSSWIHFYILRDPRQIYVHRVIDKNENSDDVLKDIQYQCLLLKSNKETIAAYNAQHSNQQIVALLYEDFLENPFDFLTDLFEKMRIIIPYSLLEELSTLDTSALATDWVEKIEEPMRRKLEGFCPWGLREWGFKKFADVLPPPEAPSAK